MFMGRISPPGTSYDPRRIRAMNITKLEFLDQAQINGETLEVWIREEWLVPSWTSN